MDRATFFQHFALLADTPNAVAKMRELILRLAVRGELVPQHVQDTPASDLLVRGEIQQRNLAKRGLTKLRGSPVVRDDERFLGSIPKGWEWARLNQLGYFCVGATPSMSKSGYWGDGVPWVTPKDMKAARIQRSVMSVMSAVG